jgi:acyl carrier protein
MPPATDPDVEARLTRVFRDVFDDDTIVLHPALTAKDIDGWDSLTHVRLLLTIERTLNIRISAHEMASLKSVGDLIRLVEGKLAGPKAG